MSLRSLFLRNKEKKYLMDAFMKASDGDGSFPSVGCQHLSRCPGEEAVFEARGEVPPAGPQSRLPPHPGCPTALLRTNSTGPVHIPWPEISQPWSCSCHLWPPWSLISCEFSQNMHKIIKRSSLILLSSPQGTF